MKRKLQRMTALAGAGILAVTSLAACGTEETNVPQEQTEPETTVEATDTEFHPALDTEADVTLNIAGFMANFEALDQVINDFNEYYPNVEVVYEQNSADSLAEYLKSSDYIDIFMTSDVNVRAKDNSEMYVLDQCADLSQENINTEAVNPDLLKACTLDGKLARIPIAKTMCGMVVNKTLLEKEGLTIPQTYDEFIEVCMKLKEDGYVPVQASQFHAYSDMVLPMAMCILGNDQTLTDQVNSGDTSYADSLAPVYDRLQEMLEKGYTTEEVNETYPDDNYDGAILKFFDGEVPFWIATTESFSGMKKRESKSEHFSAEPFEYEFVNVPLGDDGVYVYEEPWSGFSVYKNSDNKDYAVEFLNFLCREEELNRLAEIKGMPSASVNSSDERFESILNPEKVQDHYTVNGTLDGNITATICDKANQFGHAKYADSAEVIEAIKAGE